MENKFWTRDKIINAIELLYNAESCKFPKEQQMELLELALNAFFHPINDKRFEIPDDEKIIANYTDCLGEERSHITYVNSSFPEQWSGDWPVDKKSSLVDPKPTHFAYMPIKEQK